VALFHRTAFQAIDDRLQSELGLSAGVTADIAAVFFWTYLAVLIPVGLLTDRHGARRVAAVGSLASAGGTVLFCLAGGAAGLFVGRMLIAAGSVAAFIGMMRFIALTWPEQKARLSGRALFVGNLGAMASGAPLAWMLVDAGWRPV
jgi:MFS family permease